MLRRAMVGSGGRANTFNKEQQSKDNRGNVEKRHDLHEIVVDELSREDESEVARTKQEASDGKCSNPVALELKSDQQI
jgi:hypothetical protein